MPPEKSQSVEKSELIIRRDSGLTLLPNGESSALSEIINRSLVHIQTSKALGMFHRIGTHELFGPDYRLVCAWAEELRQTPEETLHVLLKDVTKAPWQTELVSGRFKSIQIDTSIFRVDCFPSIEGLVLERFAVFDSNGSHDGVWNPLGKMNLTLVPNLTQLYFSNTRLRELDLSSLPNLTNLNCSDNELAELDLSPVQSLTSLDCSSNPLGKLDLSVVANLTELNCYYNELSDLDLSPVPNLTRLDCSSNPLGNLDLSAVPCLTELHCCHNELVELNLSPVHSLESLDCSWNPLGKLNLSVVPNLTNLDCQVNELAELDVSVVPNLRWLVYDMTSTRLTQRSDQKFR